MTTIDKSLGYVVRVNGWNGGWGYLPADQKAAPAVGLSQARVFTTVKTAEKQGKLCGRTFSVHELFRQNLDDELGIQGFSLAVGDPVLINGAS